jgi:hypothetical protein
VSVDLSKPLVNLAVFLDNFIDHKGQIVMCMWIFQLLVTNTVLICYSFINSNPQTCLNIPSNYVIGEYIS